MTPVIHTFVTDWCKILLLLNILNPRITEYSELEATQTDHLVQLLYIRGSNHGPGAISTMLYGQENIQHMPSEGVVISWRQAHLGGVC